MTNPFFVTSAFYRYSGRENRIRFSKNFLRALSLCQIKSFIIFAVLRRIVYLVCGTHLRAIAPGQHIFFEEMLQRWRAVGNTVADLTGPKLEPQTSRSGDERVATRPTGRWYLFVSAEHLSNRSPKWEHKKIINYISILALKERARCFTHFKTEPKFSHKSE